MITNCKGNAQKLVSFLTSKFSSFNDSTEYNGKRGKIIIIFIILCCNYNLVVFFKRAQIFVADVWNRFGGKGYGEFEDIDSLTMFADYRYHWMILSSHFLLSSFHYPPHLSHISLTPSPPFPGYLSVCYIWAY